MKTIILLSVFALSVNCRESCDDLGKRRFAELEAEVPKEEQTIEHRIGWHKQVMSDKLQCAFERGKSW